jgi:DNA polymerase-4
VSNILTLNSLPKAIAHIDCDAFFASVEQSLNPDLRGKPVVTGKERGIAAAMSYEAKARGVTRGMRLFEIKKICPECIILPNDYETYSLVSKRLFGIIRRFTPDVEEYSIDEAFADLSGLRRLYKTSYAEIAKLIQKTIGQELGLTVSVGLSLTKSLAKICSKQNKPHGFTCVKGYELHQFLPRIETERVCGFGPASVALLAKQGIYSVWDYVSRPKFVAKKLLGKIGEELWHELRGDVVYVLGEGQAKHLASISKVKTFTPPSNNKAFVKAQLLRNVESAFMKLRRHHLRVGVISIFIRDKDYRGYGKQAELTRPTSATLEVVRITHELFEKIFNPQVYYRQSGIHLTYLDSNHERQYELFEDNCHIQKLNDISKCLDEINLIHGKHSVYLGATHALNQFQQHLGDRGDVSKRKQTLLKGETKRHRLNIPLWDLRV